MSGTSNIYGDTLLPTSYTATATYTASGSRKVATGYVTTASYTGEITAEGVQSVRYTVTYLGAPIEEAKPEAKEGVSIFPWVILLLALTALAGGGAAAFVFLRPNAVIYAMNAKGVAYKRLGAQRLTVRKPKLDFTRLREYPAAEASVELKRQVAHKLSGRPAAAPPPWLLSWRPSPITRSRPMTWPSGRWRTATAARGMEAITA